MLNSDHATLLMTLRHGPVTGRAARAFTAVELTIALAILSVAAVAVTAIAASVSQGWSAMKQSHGVVLGQHTSGLRVERLIGESKQVLVSEVGDLLGVVTPSRVALWMHDDADHNGQPELCETALLVHDRGGHSLYLYDFKERNALNGIPVVLGQLVGLLPQLETLSANTVNLLAVRRRIVAQDVQQAAFWQVPAVAGGCTSVEYVLKTSDGRSIYGTATLRADQ